MTITYTIGTELYMNMTNRCTNNCTFCIRHFGDGVGSAKSLWLEREPSCEEILAEIDSRGLEGFSEVVFCGYGEPMERAEDIARLCREIKKRRDIPTRVNTNGQADLITGRRTAPLLKGVMDTVSVSLNAPDARTYAELCKPVFGEKAFDAILAYIRDCKLYVPHVVASVVDVITPEQIEQCRELARSLGVELRVRHMWKEDSTPTE